MQGTGEFAGVVQSESDSRRTLIPTVEPGIEAALRFVERANAISVDIGTYASFRAVGRGGNIFVRSELKHFSPRNWTWDEFARRLVAYETLWNSWMTARKRGVPFKEDKDSPFNEPGPDLLGSAVISMESLPESGAIEAPFRDLFGNHAGSISLRITQNGELSLPYSVAFVAVNTGIRGPIWIRYQAAVDFEGKPEYTSIPFVANSCKDARHVRVDSEITVEVWCEREDDVSIKASKRELKKNPLTTALGSPESTGGKRMICVVCGKSGRKGEVRKSGFKCTGCIGTPSVLRGKPNTDVESRQYIRHVSALTVGDPDIARQFLSPVLPGVARN
ncbi:hypothetical protein DIPPA_31028 [Diplonema papillatum]|nr:hypothetical protein DIPPA_31028 [Diplonema papillatum]